MRKDGVVTNGKFEGLTHISNLQGQFAIVATDQRDDLRKLINPQNPEEVTSEELKTVKKALIRNLAGKKSPGKASGILVDAIYSRERRFLESCNLRADIGLLMGIEASEYGPKGQTAPETSVFGGLEADEAVRRVKMWGAAAVKLMVYYHPSGPTRRHQESVVRAVGRACERNDIPFLLEPLSHHLEVGPSKNMDAKKFAEIKPGIVIETARELSKPEYGADVLKAEYPLDVRFAEELGQDPSDACRELDETCQIPWVVLSAGVDFDEFVEALKHSVENGASGFLCGRAIWKEAVASPDMEGVLLETGVRRLNRLVEMVERRGRPWYKKYVSSISEIDVIRGE